MKRVFKTKTFSRWANRVILDAQLCIAAREIEQGIFEADLGGGLCKKRVATQGQGKRGGARTLVAKRHKDAIFFLSGRIKSQPGGDFSEVEVAAAKLIGAALQAANSGKLDELVASDVLREICNGS